ncbi:carboxypeptidase regulatory-like domain-containing protein [Candidatus Woesearchaeota archaeon]|nr:carboxypeptidase regulatory-like domain-containing protein [Candidatus Woesearchaeota archaeon]
MREIKILAFFLILALAISYINFVLADAGGGDAGGGAADSSGGPSGTTQGDGASGDAGGAGGDFGFGTDSVAPASNCGNGICGDLFSSVCIALGYEEVCWYAEGGTSCSSGLVCNNYNRTYENCANCQQDCGACCDSNTGQSCGSCGGTVNCDGSCSIPTPVDYGQSCGNCGTVNCAGSCISQGPCSSGQTQCAGSKYQSCSSGCQWENSGTDADGDGVDSQCGDSLCENSPGVSDSTKTAAETACTDSLDNDCDGRKDANQGANSDPDCCSFTQSAETTCDGTDNDCDGVIDEGCDDDNDNYCDSGMATQGSPPACTAGGGDCNDNNVNVNPSKAEICNNGIDDNCNAKTDCQDTVCTGQTGPNGVLCCQSAANCVQDDCKIESCANNACQYSNRNACDSTECAAGSYCDAAGGNCASADNSNYVCLNCASDATSGYSWTWNPPNHQDAGKGYGGNFFNSDGSACPPSSCSKPNCACYDANNNPINHKSQLATGQCCGDDANEFYKPDYYGAECTNNVDDCVWSTGDTQASNTGNAQWWCHMHEWGECKDSTIGAKFGGVTCTGTAGDNAWTPNAQAKPENQYSCTDGLDNDGDGLADCQDSDCDSSVTGTVKNQNNQPVALADVSATKDSAAIKSATTDTQGRYAISPINCGAYSLVASHADYTPQAKSIELQPNQQLIANFSLVLGTSCEADCTFAGDSIVHAACDGQNGCSFYDSTAKAACDNSQPGWARDYNSTHYIICPSGAPQLKIEIGASISCESGTLVKVTRIVVYNGKPVKLVVAACG